MDNDDEIRIRAERLGLARCLELFPAEIVEAALAADRLRDLMAETIDPTAEPWMPPA
jgi:hypothetical protein